MENKSYHYHVAHNNFNRTTNQVGFGMTFVTLTVPMNTIAAVQAAKEVIEEQIPGFNVVILTWNLLEGEA